MSCFTLKLMPRFNETDALGHINNTVIPIWFESAREPIFKIFNPELAVAKWNLIVAGFSINYKAQTYLGKEVQVDTQVIDIGNASFKLKQQCYQKGILTAESIVSMVHFNYQTNKSVPIPKEIKTALVANMSN